MALTYKSLPEAEHAYFSILSGLQGNAPISECKAKVFSDAGYGGAKKPLSQMEREWLQGTAGSSKNNEGDLWRELVASQGITPSRSTAENKFLFYSSQLSRMITVDGAVFKARGINYSSNGIDDTTNPWYQETTQIPFDAADIKDGGYNLYKIYGTEANGSSHTAAIDAILAVHPSAKFLVLDFVTYDTDYSVATGGTNRTNKINDFVAMVNIFKNRPEVIGYGFANENNLAGNRSDGTSVADWYSLVNAACVAGKAADTSGNKFFFTVDADLGTYPGDASLPDLDVLGLNIYRGTTFTDLVADIKAITKKPVFLSEFGIERVDNTAQEQTDQANEELALIQEAENGFPYISSWVLFKWSHTSTTGQFYHITAPLAQGAGESRTKYTAYTTIKNYITTTKYGG